MQGVHPTVECESGVIIGKNVTIGAGCKIGAYSIIKGETVIGENNTFSSHTIIGGDPQDLKYMGGGKLTIGDNNTFREFSTVHRGHLSEEGTVIGNDNFFLTAVHIAHDCIVGNNNFLANNVLLAGHVEIGNNTNMSGYVGVHQFCRIGDGVMISGLSGVRQDVPPYVVAQGDPAVIYGVNSIGLKRNGWTTEETFKVKEGYRLFRGGLYEENEYLKKLLKFKEKSERGILSFKRKSK